ncbi:hypothetical protein KR009_001017 [Drosophila setifemur]|nr:hypothetical protein KR009_001017 [Drosophila setifemur]
MTSEGSDTAQFNADELQPPSWLNAEFIAEVLRKNENAPELEVIDLKITPASAKGDHYASIMFRTTAEYTTSSGKFSKSLIVKSTPEEEGHKKEMLKDSFLFSTEIGMYSKVLPEFERLLRQAGDDTKLFVPCIYHSLEPRQILVFEDLVPQGYSVIRDRPITLEELKSVYTKLGKMHALSMKLLNEQPDFLKDFKYGMCEMTGLINDPMMTTGMELFLDMLEKTPELKKYKPHFEKIKDSYFQRQVDVMREYRTNRQHDGIYVLIHGDFHIRNMMFKHNKETGVFEDMMLLDFQMCNIAPPSVDLIYSIHILMEIEHRWNHKKELINYYHSILEETLRKINYKGQIPTQESIWKLIVRHKFYGEHNTYFLRDSKILIWISLFLEFFLVSTFVPNLMATKSKDIQIENFFLDPEGRRKAFFLANTQEEFRKLLPEFEKLHYFDDL